MKPILLFICHAVSRAQQRRYRVDFTPEEGDMKARCAECGRHVWLRLGMRVTKIKMDQDGAETRLLCDGCGEKYERTSRNAFAHADGTLHRPRELFKGEMFG